MRKRERHTVSSTDSELDLDPGQRERMIVGSRGKEKGSGERARPRKLLSISSSRDRLHFHPRLLTPRGARLFSFFPLLIVSPFQSARDISGGSSRLASVNRNRPCLIGESFRETVIARLRRTFVTVLVTFSMIPIECCGTSKKSTDVMHDSFAEIV